MDLVFEPKTRFNGGIISSELKHVSIFFHLDDSNSIGTVGVGNEAKSDDLSLVHTAFPIGCVLLHHFCLRLRHILGEC